MRFLTVAAAVSVVAVASAQTEKYPFKPDGACVEACTLKEGKLLFPNFTHDENSPNWLESLGFDHDRSHPKYSTMMMNAGICMSACPVPEQELFRAQFQAKTEWYQKAKSGAGKPEPTTGGDGGASATSVRPTTAPTGASVAPPAASGSPAASGAHGSASAPAGGKPTDAPRSGAVSVASGMVGVAAAALLSAVALL
ncbi:hypothetical protein BGZ75_001782 [Mortierella antarctica]|nr:hypothetical protein BGZ67_004964 [Mortierella alpina]KAF9986479.1 hypothetical protein BGZ75_001782 [Mortierella antarctica]